MTIGLVFVVLAVGVVAVLGYLRRAPSSEGLKGRVSQSWLMEQRADSKRDRFD